MSPKRRRLALYLRCRPHNFSGLDIRAFLHQLLRHLRGPIDLLWDRGPIHRRREVKAFLAKHPRLHVHYFPAYAPELNPAEYVWAQGDKALANGAPDDLGELRRAGHCHPPPPPFAASPLVLHLRLGSPWVIRTMGEIGRTVVQRDGWLVENEGTEPVRVWRGRKRGAGAAGVADEVDGLTDSVDNGNDILGPPGRSSATGQRRSPMATAVHGYDGEVLGQNRGNQGPALRAASRSVDEKDRFTRSAPLESDLRAVR